MNKLKIFLSFISFLLAAPFIVLAEPGKTISPGRYYFEILEIILIISLGALFIFIIRRKFKLYSYEDLANIFKGKMFLINLITASIISFALAQSLKKFYSFLYHDFFNYTYLMSYNKRANIILDLMHSLRDPEILIITLPIILILFLSANSIISSRNSFSITGFLNTSLFYSVSGFLITLFIQFAYIK